MIRIKTLEFNTTDKKYFYCNLTKYIALRIMKGNGFYKSDLINTQFPYLPVYIDSKAKTYIQAKRACREFLQYLFKNIIEIEKEN